MQRGRATLMALALIVAMSIGAQAARAADDPPGRVGRMVEVQGTVWLFDASQGEWTAAPHNRPLTTGDRLATDAGALAEVRIGSTTLRLDGDTDVELRRIDDQRLAFHLHRGALALRVRSPEVAGETEVVTPEGRLLPQRPGHYRVERRDDLTRAAAWRGALQFDGRDSALDIPAGRQAELWIQGPQQATHYTWRPMPGDAFAEWVARDDAADEASVSARYVSTEMTGWEDLDRHGSWSTHAEYGPLWVPARVDPGWAPYRHGHWKWVAPWGWTWIDHAPWGFAPFHYGRWVHVGNRWCWAPGARVVRPVYAPALVAWVGHSSPGVSVSVTVGSPHVGWVPLAPWEAYRPWYRHGQRHVVVVNQPHEPPRHRHPPHGHGHDARERIPARPGGAVPIGAPPHGAYANQQAPGAVTMVSTDLFRGRRVPVQPGQAVQSARSDAPLQGLVPLTQAPAAPQAPVAAAVQPGAVPPPLPRVHERERVPVPQPRTVAPPPGPAVVHPAAPPVIAPAVAPRVTPPQPLPPAVASPMPAPAARERVAPPRPEQRPEPPPPRREEPRKPEASKPEPGKPDARKDEGRKDDGKRGDGKPESRERAEPPRERGGPRAAQQ